jgi:Dolichyl-phosphate-mannose-protein mannosyltransferase
VTARLRELLAVLALGSLLTVVMTWPLASRIGRLGRIDNGDGQLSIWNVAWVARTLVVDPVHVFDANIFYPHTHTLAYSENNLGAGILAIPGYWATRNPLTAHNSAVLVGFVLTFAAMYYLVRLLTADRAATIVSAVCFAFTPFMFAHAAHVQLLMTAGLPLSMYAFHRFADRRSPARGAALGAAMAVTALFCGYYGVFVVLMVGFAVLVVATTRGLWTNGRYWLGLAAGAVAAGVIVAPAFLPYVTLQRVQGFRRALDEARIYSSNWSDYFASAAHAHDWMLAHLPRWVEVAFPGFVAVTLGIAGAWIARARGKGETLAIYGGLALLAFWASFGPAGGLYSALYHAVPLFAWLRVPARFALIVVFGVSVLAGFGASALLTATRRFTHRTAAAAALVLITVAELLVPSNLREMNGFEPVYRTLATLPRAPIIEMPFYLEGMFQLHSKYMLYSTTHWMPLVNGYSDYIPPDFVAGAPTLAAFPSRAALKLLEPLEVRYAVFHMYGYNESNRRDVLARLEELAPYFRLIYAGEDTRLYEIISYPRD